MRQPASFKSLEVWTLEVGTVVYCLYGGYGCFIVQDRSRTNRPITVARVRCCHYCVSVVVAIR